MERCDLKIEMTPYGRSEASKLGGS